MTENNPHKMSKIYDLLNDQPHLQELIRDSYYKQMAKANHKQMAKANHKLAIGELDRAFTNCRLHMVEVIGEYDEDGIIDFMVTSAYNSDFRYVFRGFYGKDWYDYYSYEYLDPDYNDLFSESDDDEDM